MLGHPREGVRAWQPYDSLKTKIMDVGCHKEVTGSQIIVPCPLGESIFTGKMVQIPEAQCDRYQKAFLK